MTINYQKIIFLNLIIFILNFILFFHNTFISVIGIIFLGFIASLFFKVDRTVHFFKLMFVNALFFHILSVLFFYLALFIIYIMGEINSDRSSFILGLRSSVFIYTISYSFGYFFGLIPQVIRERFETNKALD